MSRTVSLRVNGVDTGLSCVIDRAEYQARFEAARALSYPVVDLFEAEHGYAIDRERLEAAARVLACPVKVHAPHWQHGRILYTVARAYVAHRAGPFTMLDIGTAKGFSALCLTWAMADSGVEGSVYSVDVIDPRARVSRNTVAEVDGLLTLAETLAPWPEAASVQFDRSTGIAWLGRDEGRVNLAFVDGKHTTEAVLEEACLLGIRQERGDVVMFDDVQIPAVGKAVDLAAKWYDLRKVDLRPERVYAIGVRK